MNSGLTPEEKAKATKAARDARWHDKQADRWERLYRAATSAGHLEEGEKFAAIIEWHHREARAARQILKDLGF